MTSTHRIDCGDGVTLERGVATAMRDGTVLRADVYHPPGDTPAPALLMRQPYGRDIASTVVYAHPTFFARAGYLVVIQDVRGRGGSEGDFYPFRHEGRDGYDTVTALHENPACNGRVGMYGFSYQGMTQWLAAAERPPGLVALAPAMAALDLYHGWFYHHGVLRIGAALGWGVQMLREDARRRDLPDASGELEGAFRRARDLPAEWASGHPAYLYHPGLPSYLRDWLSHDRADGYWQALDVSATFERIECPALHVAGWYDLYLKGSIDAYLALTRLGRAPQHLVVGPWVHIPWGDRAGEARFGPAALLDTDGLLLRWFNHWLRGTGEFAGEPAIRHFVLGEEAWRTRETWNASQTLRLFLRSDGRANSRKGDGRLEREAPAGGEPRDFFVHDPEVPVLAPGGLGGAPGGFDQAALELGNNLLVYTTPPLEHELGVFGSPRLTVFATTSAPDADYVGKLVRVRPDGRCEFLCIGAARASYLWADYRADEVRRWEFALEPTSCRFEAGDRVRLEVAGSAFPLYERNAGTRLPPLENGVRAWRRSTHAVLHDARHPSALALPLAA